MTNGRARTFLLHGSPRLSTGLYASRSAHPLRRTFGQPPWPSVVAALVLGIICLLFSFGPTAMMVTLLILLLAVLAVRQFGEQTGDVERSSRSAKRVGAFSAIVSSTTNVTIAITTGFVATGGVEALAGYGAGARLEFLLVPLSYGIGGPAGIMIGTNVGAGQSARALQVAWTTVLLAGLVTEAIGLAASCWPSVWIEAFSSDPRVLAAGATYLRTVGPMFGFFGIGYALYCAGQGTGQMAWPVAGACLRAALAIGGGALCVHIGTGPQWVFVAVSIGMASFGCLALPGLILKNGFGLRNTLGGLSQAFSPAE